MTKFKPFRLGEMLEVRNSTGDLIAWGAFESEDKSYTFLKMILPAPRKPYWKFEVGRYPNSQFAFIRLPGKRGDLPLLERALREVIEDYGNGARSRSAIFMMRAADPQMPFEHRRFGTEFRYEAVIEFEVARMKTKGVLKGMHFPSHYESDIYTRVKNEAVTRLVMDRNIDQELLISRVVRGRWSIEHREYFLEQLERIGSPHLNLLREVLGAKNLKHEAPERFPTNRHIDW